MPLDQVILSHLEQQDSLEDKIEEDIDILIGKINITDLMNGAEDPLLNIAEVIQQRLKDDYYAKSAENGISLSKDITKDGDIKIPDSNDPELNEDLIDGT